MVPPIFGAVPYHFRAACSQASLGESQSVSSKLADSLSLACGWLEHASHRSSCTGPTFTVIFQTGWRQRERELELLQIIIPPRNHATSLHR